MIDGFIATGSATTIAHFGLLQAKEDLPHQERATCPMSQRQCESKWSRSWHCVQDLHGEGIIVSPRMMADHMPDYVTSVLGRLSRDRRRQNPEFLESHGPAVGTGDEGTSGPSRSHMAIDIDSESDSELAAEDETELQKHV